MRFQFLTLSLVLPLATFAQAPAAPSKADVVNYRATIDNVKYLFGPATPVSRLKPGNILDAKLTLTVCQHSIANLTRLTIHAWTVVASERATA